MSFRILALDGGGAKGAYTLGALKEIELRLGGGALFEKFDMIFGTSTGSIIASLIGLGWKVDEIYKKYKEIIPYCFEYNSPKKITLRLTDQANRIFGDRKFDSFLTRVCIVATNVDQDRPIIFKSKLDQLYSGTPVYEPGFGATISAAVLGSCAAVPYLLAQQVKTTTDGTIHIVDGGFVANNPALFALTDAVGALGKKQEEICLVSIGTGRFVEKEPKSPLWRKAGLWLVNNYMPIDIFSKSLSASAESTDRIIRYAFPKTAMFRLSSFYPGNSFVTHLLENDATKIEKMYSFGRSSFCDKERLFDDAWGIIHPKPPGS